MAASTAVPRQATTGGPERHPGLVGFVDAAWYIPSQGGNHIAITVPTDVALCYSEENLRTAMNWCMTVATDDSQYPGTTGSMWAINYFGSDGPTCGLDGPHAVECSECNQGNKYHCAMVGPIGTNDGSVATLGYTNCANIGWQIDDGESCIFTIIQGATCGCGIRRPPAYTYVPPEGATEVLDQSGSGRRNRRPCTDR